MGQKPVNEERSLVDDNEDSPVKDEKGIYVIQELQESAIYEQYEGFIPHPEIFKGLSEVDSSFPERVMKMAEDNNELEIRIKDQESKLAQKKVNLEARGQVFIFTLALILIGASVIFAFAGLEKLAIPAIIGGMAHIFTTAIRNLRK